MKNIQIIGLMLSTLLVLGTVDVSSASAEEALWLISGAEVTALTSVETIGQLLFEDSNAFGGKAAVKECGFIIDSTTGPNGEGEIAEWLTLGGTSIAANKLGSGGVGIECKPESICSGTESMVWPSKLPFQTLLELMSNGQILNVFLEFGWTTLCLVVGINSGDECNMTSGLLMENMTGATVLGIFNAESENGTCQVGGAGTARLEGEFETRTLTGLEVTVDSP